MFVLGYSSILELGQDDKQGIHQAKQVTPIETALLPYPLYVDNCFGPHVCFPDVLYLSHGMILRRWCVALNAILVSPPCPSLTPFFVLYFPPGVVRNQHSILVVPPPNNLIGHLAYETN